MSVQPYLFLMLVLNEKVGSYFEFAIKTLDIKSMVKGWSEMVNIIANNWSGTEFLVHKKSELTLFNFISQFIMRKIRNWQSEIIIYFY